VLIFESYTMRSGAGGEDSFYFISNDAQFV
jgi:hypothetical protein